MGRLLKKITNGSLVEYDKGKFDDWCVYLTKPNLGKYAPRDNEYFSKFIEFAEKFGYQTIYDYFVQIYNETNKNIHPGTLQMITNIAARFDEDKHEIDIWFTVIYAGMVAEENKEFTKLGKRLKRLGIHQILIERMSPEHAANFSKGKKWKELDEIMKSKGF
ncbi:MAG: hypothetical protein A2X13_15170 [Bacteroidetes bacterium GWC2_33_15]|nr:MAG: hypothetical protein A2X10_07235 [Bacteroidetes bacterium GWA2_33_15]OFX50208.1 MAG: hypothetical protein A2X13_15170 [Bacteroidetes bacterium GWC2_33_15]OFX65360.1 MAG: hypothetical protein A2X15_04745 [Bacteroidetes bacterium GWB2_32_14]OFX70587.1 MAG: hypothetical protein A2X14_04800 [Bacteroidetes bacterium GWD2_33_33]HAN19536.1 hypothetical protein [Bacteroidales bacterium]